MIHRRMLIDHGDKERKERMIIYYPSLNRWWCRLSMVSSLGIVRGASFKTAVLLYLARNRFQLPGTRMRIFFFSVRFTFRIFWTLPHLGGGEEKRIPGGKKKRNRNIEQTSTEEERKRERESERARERESERERKVYHLFCI